MKKRVISILAVALSLVVFCGCASLERHVTDVKSDFTSGLNRTIKVYTATGELIAEYSGKIDIESNSGSEVKFDHDGKRYIYYNCFVETIADL